MIKKKLIFALMGVFAIIGITISISYAWFTSGNQFDSPEVSGYSKAAYFAGGDGSKDNPYIIANKRHLYNLAWLQYLGKFNQEVGSDDENTAYVDESQYMKTYYFELNNDIDCGDMYMPPIGTTKYPFIGNFNGNGKVISNFKTTNIYNDITMKPSSVVELEDCSIVGLFGVVGPYDGMTNSTGVTPLVKATYTDANSKVTTHEINAIYDFYINDADIYSHGETLVGIIAGYANGFMKNIGVHYADISLASGSTALGSYSSISGYSLVGEYNEDEYAWSDKPSAGGVGYGTSTDLKALYETLGNEEGSSINKLHAFPFRPSNQTILEPSASKLDVILSAGTKQVAASNYQMSSANNIGYYVGSDIKMYNKSSVDYSNFYIPNHSSDSTLLTGDDAPGQNVIDYLNQKGTYLMRLTGSSQFDTNNEGGLTVIENGQVGSYVGKVLLPIRCVWVAPIKAGKLEFVFMNVENSEKMGVRIMKLTRSTPGNYGTYFSGSTNVYECNGLMLPGKAYYITIDVTDEDIEAGYEFAITNGDGGSGYKPYIAYIDIGAEGGTAEQTPVDLLSGIDFVKISNVTSSGFEDMLDTNYSKSNLLFAINLGDSSTSAVVGVAYYYRRKDITGDEDYTDVVLYFDESSSTTTGLSLKTLGTGTAVKASDRTCQYREGTITSAQIASNTIDAYTALDNATAAYSADYYSKITALNNLLTSFKTLSNSDLADTAWSSSTVAAKTTEIETLLESSLDAYYQAGANNLIAVINAIPNGDITSSNYKEYTDEIMAAYNAIEAESNTNVLNKVTNMSTFNARYAEYLAAIPTFSVTFNTNGGSSITSQSVKDGELATKPSNPTKSNARFIGWYSNEGLTVEFDFSTPITANTTIYAKWEEIVTREITFETNGGSTIASQIIEDGTKVSKPSDPTRNGYYFVGWYSNEALSNEFNFSNTITSDITIYAKWQEKYTITFVYADTTLGIEMANTTATTNINAKLDSLPKETSGDYTITGWYSDEEFNNNVTLETVFNSNTTLYAKWEEQLGYMVNFETDGGSTIASQTISEGGTAVRPVTPSKSGYSFAGWFTDNTYSTIYNFDTVVTTNKTIYAKWINEADYDLVFTLTFYTSAGGTDSTYTLKLGYNVNSEKFCSQEEMKAYLSGVEGYEFEKMLLAGNGDYGENLSWLYNYTIADWMSYCINIYAFYTPKE